MSQQEDQYLVPPANLVSTVRDDLDQGRRRRWVLWMSYVIVITIGFCLYAFSGRAPIKMASTLDGVGAIALLGMGAILMGLAMGIVLPTVRAVWRYIGLLFCATVVFLFYSGISAEFSSAGFWSGYICLLEATVLGFVGLCSALIIGHRFYRRHAPTGMLLGMGGSLIALAPLHIGCTNKSLTHLMSWHATSIAVLCLVALATWRFVESD